jgi:AcrR family transcriptional regulator
LRLLEEATAALDEEGFDQFNVQRVLDRAGVSRATMYRHFEDVDGLIEAALGEVYRREVDRYSAISIELIASATDPAQFRRLLRTMLDGFSAISPTVRLQRAHTIALAATRPRLATAIALVQEAVTDRWTSVVVEGQRRGFLRADLDPRAAAVVIQALTIGRIVDDAGTTHLGNDRWAEVLFETFDRTFLTPGDRVRS